MIKKHIYFYILSFLFITVALGSVKPATADDVESLQQKIAETKSDIEKKNNKLQEISKQINSIMSSNMSLYAKIAEIESRKKDSTKLMKQEEQELKEIQKWIDLKNEEINRKKEEMNNSVISIYKMSHITLLDRMFALSELKFVGYESFLFKSRLRKVEELADWRMQLKKNAELIKTSKDLLQSQQQLYDESLIQLYNQRAQIQQELLAKQQAKQSLNQEVLRLNSSLSNLTAQLQQAMLLKANQADQGGGDVTGGGNSNAGGGEQTPGSSSGYSLYINGEKVADSLNGPLRLIPADGNKSSILKLNGSAYYYNVLEFNNSADVFVINELPMQLYLYGLGEVPSSWHMETLKAQAIAGRTYAIKNWTKRISHGYNLLDNTFDQNYVGVYKIMAAYGDRWKQAVDATNNQVILYNGSLINAYYHSTDGGHTLASEEVWYSSLPYTRAESDWHQVNGAWVSYDANSPWSYKRWGSGFIDDNVMIDLINASIYLGVNPNSPQRQNDIIRHDLPNGGFTPDELVNALNGNDFRSVYGELQNVQSIYNNGTSQINGDSRKTIKLHIDGTKGSLDIDGGIFYTVFNSRSPGTLTLFYSNFWTAVKENGGWSFYSRGYPHRVGMCQYGAEGRAQAGQNYQQILQAYYRGTTIGTKTVGDIRIGITKVATGYALVTPYTHTTYKVLNGGNQVLDIPYGTTLKIVRNSN